MNDRENEDPAITDSKSEEKSDNEDVGCFKRKRKSFPRRIFMNDHVQPEECGNVTNEVKNTQYTPFTFLPLTLYNQFKYFFNLYFLLLALSQFVPVLQVGFLTTYLAPLILILMISLSKEAYDDIQRYRRDNVENNKLYQKVTPNGVIDIASKSIRVGDVLLLSHGQIAPADCILLKTSEPNGAMFVRTDQLDGETDWKLRHACSSTQSLEKEEIVDMNAEIYAEAPNKQIYDFIGTFSIKNDEKPPVTESLSLENTIWKSLVIASGSNVCLVVYTGKDTRALMNIEEKELKSGVFDNEVNKLSKQLFFILAAMASALTIFKGINSISYIYLVRFIVLLSSIIPTSMKVHIDISKTFFSMKISGDKKIPGTIARSTTIPEQLGRLFYLFMDKTGTLTRNVMSLKKLRVGQALYLDETVEELKRICFDFSEDTQHQSQKQTTSSVLAVEFGTSDVEANSFASILAMILCHNVSVVEEDGERTLQAASPDEVALVQYAETIGFTLVSRTFEEITISMPNGSIRHYRILQDFPFTSERKRMGIILQHVETGEITFFVKGADSVMAKIVSDQSEWYDRLDEEVSNMARDGLRTLVFGQKTLSQPAFDNFLKQLNAAKCEIVDRQAHIDVVMERLEVNLDLLCVTGVEDRLQEDVHTSLERFDAADIRCWMLTGDKIETAKCIARSARLVKRNQEFYSLVATNKQDAINKLRKYTPTRENHRNSALVIDGHTIGLLMPHFNKLFATKAANAPCVVACRCSPTQKADVVQMMKDFTGKPVAAIGDGGNDVGMIQTADIGFGIEGKEGKQASMAADYSITQFSHSVRLVLWHGRSACRSGSLMVQFIVHRGLLISFIQTLYSYVYYYAAASIYDGTLLFCYSTVYTVLPVMALLFDEDFTDDIVMQFPQLYCERSSPRRGRLLNTKAFFVWFLQAIFQATIIFYLGIFSYNHDYNKIVTLSFTVLILTELANVIIVMHRWNKWMFFSEALSLIVYILSLMFMRSIFDMSYIITIDFAFQTLLTFVLSFGPPAAGKIIQRICNTPTYVKITS
eukprot:TRINITY_DN3285_c0_g1_i3.p1 TRINITY_DN3285_c0_g1~~TRINITY_DN3285_c0_g1_i3.p1  ORF type:complete len:1044 (+),score=271.26 TRINITY_DN3285_c0_g1_i3:105-3236(+)